MDDLRTRIALCTKCIYSDSALLKDVYKEISNPELRPEQRDYYAAVLEKGTNNINKKEVETYSNQFFNRIYTV